MSTYTVTWTIEVEAESPEGAAVVAAQIAADCMDPASLARTFEVTAPDGEVTVVDLNEEATVE